MLTILIAALMSVLPLSPESVSASEQPASPVVDARGRAESAPPDPNGGERQAWKPGFADLLFASGRDGNSEVYVLRAGRQEWSNLTNHESGDNWPVWSPDGSRIAFQSKRKGNLDIWMMKEDGSNPVPLTSDPEPDYLPAWSPDGNTVVFTSWRKETGEEKRAPHIYRMNADGSQQRRLVIESLETSAGATWAPDGARIVYSRKSGENGADLFVADSDGKNERRLTSDKDVYNGSPVFSPDGRSIAFYADDGTNSALVIMNGDGTGRRTVLAEGKNWYPRWSPDGVWLVYTAAVGGGDDGNIDIFAISLTGEGKPILLAGGAKREQEGSWRPKQ